MKHQKIRDNLYDAGCHPQIIDIAIQLYQNGYIEEALQKIKKDRCRLIDELHESSRKVDCLDYLIREIEKEYGGNKND